MPTLEIPTAEMELDAKDPVAVGEYNGIDISYNIIAHSELDVSYNLMKTDDLDINYDIQDMSTVTVDYDIMPSTPLGLGYEIPESTQVGLDYEIPSKTTLSAEYEVPKETVLPTDYNVARTTTLQLEYEVSEETNITIEVSNTAGIEIETKDPEGSFDTVIEVEDNYDNGAITGVGDFKQTLYNDTMIIDALDPKESTDIIIPVEPRYETAALTGIGTYTQEIYNDRMRIETFDPELITGSTLIPTVSEIEFETLTPTIIAGHSVDVENTAGIEIEAHKPQVITTTGNVYRPSQKLVSHKIWNIFDEFGLLHNLDRLPEESNEHFKERLFARAENPSSSTEGGILNHISTALIVDSDETNLKKLEDDQFIEGLLNPDDTATEELKNLADHLNKQLNQFWDSVKWDEDYWDTVSKDTHNAIPNQIDDTDLSLEDLKRKIDNRQDGIGKHREDLEDYIAKLLEGSGK